MFPFCVCVFGLVFSMDDDNQAGVNRFRPAARRRDRIFRPDFVLDLVRKPCLLARLRFDG